VRLPSHPSERGGSGGAILSPVIQDAVIGDAWEKGLAASDRMRFRRGANLLDRLLRLEGAYQSTGSCQERILLRTESAERCQRFSTRHGTSGPIREREQGRGSCRDRKLSPCRRLPPLQFAREDAIAIGRRLREAGYATRVLIDEEAIDTFIRRALRDAGTHMGEDEGTLIFYFAGHGFSSRGSDDRETNYLATFNSISDPESRKGLSVENVQRIMNETGARRRILWIDACRDGQDGARGTSKNGFVKMDRRAVQLERAEGFRILLSTAPGKRSFEDPELGHGIFTYFLNQGIAGEAANPDGLITFDSLALYVTEKVQRYSFETERPQRPYEAGEFSGDFLVVKGLASPPKRRTQSSDMAEQSESSAPSDNPAAPTTGVALEFYLHGVRFEFAEIPAGRYEMGCARGDYSCESNESPQHLESIANPFEIGKYEVTQEEWEAVLGGRHKSQFEKRG